MSENGRYNMSPRPPCCGSGCTVCVLDYWPDDEVSTEMDELEHLLNAFEDATDSHITTEQIQKDNK